MTEAAFAGPAPHADPKQWDRLVEAVGPDGVLVAISRRMGPAVRGVCQPEDVWQEALVCAWRDREKHRWTSVRDYRSWLLTIARNRVTDIARAAAAEKRGGGAVPLALASSSGTSMADLLPAGSVTPSRIASHRERAASMLDALDSLPEEQAEVLCLHLFEERAIDRIASDLGIGEKAVRYRLRRGMESYVRRLEALRSRLVTRNDA